MQTRLTEYPNYLNFVLSFTSFSLIAAEFSTTPPQNCRFTKLGTEYVGKAATSTSGKSCQFWDKIADRGNDFTHHALLFPEGSREAARNYCRNPTHDENGPWCYVMLDENTTKAEGCSVPFCHSADCRWTGPGIEYQGIISKSATESLCLPWNETTIWDNATELICGGDESCFGCRNPDFSSSGPWCFVEGASGKTKALCNTPFCDDDSSVLVSGEYGFISTFFRMPNEARDLKIKLKLWEPSGWLDQSIAIVLSSLDVWASSSDLRNWESAIVLSLGNIRSRLHGREVSDFVDTPGLLSGIRWTSVTINWKRDADNLLVVSAGFDGKKASLVVEIDTTETILDEHNLQFFSITGSLSLLNISMPVEECMTITTSQANETFWLTLKEDSGERKLKVSFRVSQIAMIALYGDPLSHALVQIIIHQSGRVVVKLAGESRALSDYETQSFDFWSWNSFNISIIGDSLLIERFNLEGKEILGNATNSSELRGLLWATFSSLTVSHWAVNCNPERGAMGVKSHECKSTRSSFVYNGTQSIDSLGEHCVPWIDRRIPHHHSKESAFIEFGGRLNSLNFCRKLDEDSDEFCYVRKNDQELELRMCNIRLCIKEECKIAGTGSDYKGNVSLSKSLRNCKSTEEEIVCFNPNKNIAGPWCHTEDPLVPRDICRIKDCDREDSYTSLSSTWQNNSVWYFLPEWKKDGFTFWLKNWVPERDASLLILLKDVQSSYIFRYSGNGDEKLRLYRSNGVEDELLLEEAMPHLIFSAEWVGIWLRSRNNCIELGRAESGLPLVSWVPESGITIAPMFVSIGTDDDSWLGVNINPSECLVERVWGAPLRYWPINLWKREHPSLLLYLNGFGGFTVNLHHFPEESPYLALTLEDFRLIRLELIGVNEQRILSSRELFIADFDPHSWKLLEILCEESSIIVSLENETIIRHIFPDETHLAYWFGVSVESGMYAWSANCRPLDLTIEPRDGGWNSWGPWRCSAPCGGGEGSRERVCDLPPPSLTGVSCVGPATYQGPCNDFPCGTVSPEMLKIIRKHLASQSNSVAVKKGEHLTVSCNEELAPLIMQSLPDVEFLWTLNGFPPNDSKISINAELALNVSSAAIAHTGVWACSAVWHNSDQVESSVIRIVSILVTSDEPTMEVHEDEYFRLACNSFVLSHVFDDLETEWRINGTKWKNFGFSIAYEVIRAPPVLECMVKSGTPQNCPPLNNTEPSIENALSEIIKNTIFF